IKHTSVEIEVFGFGSLCVMVEGRCLLSSYVTGE
ncbi:Collagenase or related protease, partial [Snodgrassella alvi SCGC AB-598-P14]